MKINAQRQQIHSKKQHKRAKVPQKIPSKLSAYLLSCLLSISGRVLTASSPTLFDYEISSISEDTLFHCSPSDTVFYAMRIRWNSPKPVSVNLATTAIPESYKHLIDTTGKPRDAVPDNEP